jgi:predicted DNA repair protein MutK
VADKPFATQVAVPSGIGLLTDRMGVCELRSPPSNKLDDAGAWLVARGGGARAAPSRPPAAALAPKPMKALTVIGTAAMFLPAAGILMHGLRPAAMR